MIGYIFEAALEGGSPDANAGAGTGPSAGAGASAGASASAGVGMGSNAGAAGVSPEKVASFPLSPLVVARETYIRPEAQALRDHIRELDRNIAQLQQDIASSNEIKNIDFGEGDWLYALWGSCWFWTQPTGEMYTYEVCAFKQAKQGATLLGKYEKLGINTANAEVTRLPLHTPSCTL